MGGTDGSTNEVLQDPDSILDQDGPRNSARSAHSSPQQQEPAVR
jgi:hypothetical protein